MTCCELASHQDSIERAFLRVKPVALKFASTTVSADSKPDGSPVTEADIRIGVMLKELLWSDGDGWLSEEDDEIAAHDAGSPTWIVDPIDGTKEFTQGRSDWAVSVACMQNGEIVAAGILAPAMDQVFLDHRCRAASDVKTSCVATGGLVPSSRILASRSEVQRGDWDIFPQGSFERQEVGSIAYKLALVSAGLAEGVVSLAPKNSWDFAAGVMLVEVGGGCVKALSGEPIEFNRARFKVNGLISGSGAMVGDFERILGVHA